tara:strand:+ start:382 stop:561 length:180 start_codon:yes stop_codon:yes gene_type:complete
LTLIFDIVNTKRIRSNIPVGKVKYRKSKGTSTKLENPTSPKACFFAKSKRVVNPVMPKF